ncbi:MAG: hypothetical protein ACFCUQ_17165 [Kiloniellales bacterium]
MADREEPRALRESIDLDEWLADQAGLAGDDRRVRELEARVREKQARLKSLTDSK